MSESNPQPEETVTDKLKEAEMKAVSWFEQNKKHTLLFIAFVVIIIVGYQGMGMRSAYVVQKMQDEYLEAQETDNLIRFAQKYPRSHLGGMAFIESADSAFESQQFDDAKNYYQKAIRGLKKTELSGRAKLGLAVSTLKAGDRPAGLKGLETLMKDDSAMGSFRGEAAYQLALEALQTNEPRKAKKFLDAIENITGGGYWNERAEILRQTVPELR